MVERVVYFADDDRITIRRVTPPGLKTRRYHSPTLASYRRLSRMVGNNVDVYIDGWQWRWFYD